MFGDVGKKLDFFKSNYNLQKASLCDMIIFPSGQVHFTQTVNPGSGDDYETPKFFLKFISLHMIFQSYSSASIFLYLFLCFAYLFCLEILCKVPLNGYRESVTPNSATYFFQKILSSWSCHQRNRNNDNNGKKW